MAINKLHDEFHGLDMEDGWQLPEGYDPASGAQELILSGALDTDNKQGSRTRLLRLPAGLFTKKPFVHDYWEEVFLVQGDLTVGNDEHGQGGKTLRGLHLCGASAWRVARSVQVERGLRAAGSPLLRSGLIMPRIADLAKEPAYSSINRLLLRNPAIANMLDLCAVSIPCHAPEDAPVGLMLMGRHMSDRRLLAIGIGVEAVVRRNN